MVVFISVYSKGKTFDDVRDVYCNFTVSDQGKPFASFALNPPNNSTEASSCMLVEIFRIQNTLWAIRPNSYYFAGI